MSAINRLLREKEMSEKDTLARLKFKAPALYRRVAEIIKSRGGRLGDFSWSDLADTILTVKASKEISADERKAADAELKVLREKTAAVEKQLKLEKQLQQEKNRGITLAQQAGMMGDSLLGQIMAKPWAIPAVIGLGFALFRSIRSRRR